MSGPSTRPGESGAAANGHDAPPTEPGTGAGQVVVIRAADAETLAGPTIEIRLLADSSTTGGALSTQRVTMAEGADGATPHLHRMSSELFYVLSGSADVLTGDRVITANEGDLVVVPPETPHAFAATPGQSADLLIVITPGVERFEYFRHLGRIATGEATAESLLDVQDHYDTQFLVSPPWRAARAKPTS
jgi:mannose-6-phosphate isomerase-like protein (cupin superfamily)